MLDIVLTTSMGKTLASSFLFYICVHNMGYLPIHSCIMLKIYIIQLVGIHIPVSMTKRPNFSSTCSCLPAGTDHLDLTMQSPRGFPINTHTKIYTAAATCMCFQTNRAFDPFC